jgi:hypothetical protein
MAQAVEHLPSKCKALSSNPSTEKSSCGDLEQTLSHCLDLDLEQVLSLSIDSVSSPK